MKEVKNMLGREPLLRAKRTSLVLSMIASLLTSSAALADDISVYGTASKNPRILFALDYSYSMRHEVDGTNSTRIDILRESVLEMMNTYSDKVDFGLGPMFAVSGGGVQWPISDLRLDANYTDPSIPAGSASGIEVVTDIINKTEIQWGTATVPALAESVQYFRGGPVNFGGIDAPNTQGFKPLQWDTELNTFEEFKAHSGSSAAFSNPNAYSVGTAATSKGYCRRIVNGTGRAEQLAPNDCSLLPQGTTVSNCTLAPARSVGYDHYVNRDRFHDFQVCEYRHNDQWVGTNYKSPITNECQANAIILISDGEPGNSIPDYMVDQILPGNRDFASCDDVSRKYFKRSSKVAGNCAMEIAEHIADVDQVPGIPGSTITTHTIGFGLPSGEGGAQYLKDLAFAGKGKYNPAENSDQLLAALNDLISIELPDSQQFSNFTVDINRASFSNDNRAYVPLFRPSDSDSWAGNIKGYFIGENGLEDVDGNPATETVEAVSQFTEESRSFWSDGIDGNSVSAGGASSKLNPDSRKLYTYTGNTFPAAGIRLATSTDYELSEKNNTLRPDMFGFPNRVNTTDLLDWIKKAPMGESLHSNTVISNYENAGSIKRVVYAMTNQGFLHAINASTPVVEGDYSGGEEIFAFMPSDLLSNITFMQNGGFAGEHIYGLDGAITPWHDDKNNDGIVNGEDELLLIFGMRRGGKNYYAMNVTDPTNPKLVWQIKGGVDAGFENLAQTWSAPQLITVKSSRTSTGTERVMVFGGGYDDSVDDIHESTASKGNSIYMIDKDGELLWSASDRNMKYGIPSDVRIIDSNQDSLADRMYVGDLGGQIWRVDFDDVTSARQFDVNLFADITLDRRSLHDYQPFFYPPSISRDNDEDRLLVSIGSGNRDNPIKDRTGSALITFFDDNPDFGAPNRSPNVIKQGDLANATRIEFVSAEILSKRKGWFINLQEGEKVLSPVTIVNGDMLATTYKPTVDPDYNGCEVPTASRKLWAVSLKDAGPPNNVLTEEFNTLPASRYIDIEADGIPPEPYALAPKDSPTFDVYVGNEKQLELQPTIERIFWYTE